jgi:glycosyltransferase involved in cell wall biosynthesis
VVERYPVRPDATRSLSDEPTSPGDAETRFESYRRLDSCCVFAQTARIFDPAKIVAIPNGVDVDHFDVKSKRTGGSGRFQIGIIGHLSPIKGQDQFLQAASRVISTRDDVDLMIVGEDKSRSGENRRAIERVIDELGLGDRVRMTGWVDDVRDVLATIDLLVSAARSEPFGLVIAEAMAAGVPVIATSTESATEIIEDGVTGRLVSIGDPTALAAAITELLSHEKMRRSLATNALGSVRTNFSLNRMVTATEDLYSAIVLA